MASTSISNPASYNPNGLDSIAELFALWWEITIMMNIAAELGGRLVPQDLKLPLCRSIDDQWPTSYMLAYSLSKELLLQWSFKLTLLFREMFLGQQCWGSLNKLPSLDGRPEPLEKSVPITVPHVYQLGRISHERVDCMWGFWSDDWWTTGTNDRSTREYVWQRQSCSEQRGS